MPLGPGARLGPYEIQSPLGAGGMGEVYKARDTRLDRTVAIKILPEALATDPQFRERFDREARAISQLTHPHICTLYDVGDQQGTAFLVMEYLEGETLADRLKKGALPLDDALKFAIQIADALSTAHRHGIVHRDLKPGNVMLTKAGAKLLDFGLAKASGPPIASDALSMLPTTPPNLTAQGTLLGTFQYMAPEQLEGQEADARTDIFAFGAVVYEMCTGKKAFEGKSQASLLGAIMRADPPPMATFQPLTPPALDRVVRKSLAKDPERRWQSAADLADELTWIADRDSEATPPPGSPAKGAYWQRLLVWGGALLLLAAAAGIAVRSLTRTDSTPKPVTRFVLALPPGDVLVSGGVVGGPRVALSPDGRYLAYVAARGTTQQIFLRAMDSAEPRPIAGTEGAGVPFFSADSRWLGYNASGVLYKIPVTGGIALKLTANAAGAVSSWGSMGTIAFAGAGGPLQQVPDSGGKAQPLTHLDQGEIRQRSPDFLPDGNAVLFSGGPDAAPQIAVQSIATGQRRNLLPGGGSPRYVRSGHLVYVQSGTIMAVPFDPVRLEVTGTALPVAQGLLQYPDGTAFYSISNTGTLVYVSGNTEEGQRRLVWVDRNGSAQDLPAPPRQYDWPQISPDGRRVAIEIGPQIWLYDLARDTLARFTFEGDLNQAPAWTPDGKRIAFNSDKEGASRNLFWQLADGSGGLERLSTSESVQVPKSWSPDGQRLAFHEVGQTTQRDIWVLSLSDRKAVPFLRTMFTEGAPSFSPDGRWIAYVSNEAGRPQIYVQPYPGPGGKWQISADVGTEPVWNRNGRELFYRSGNKMMAVDVSTQAAFSAGKPHMLFEGQYVTSAFPLIGVAYDVSPDGRRFLMLKETVQTTAASQINVVQNWFEDLKRLVPTK